VNGSDSGAGYTQKTLFFTLSGPAGVHFWQVILRMRKITLRKR